MDQIASPPRALDVESVLGLDRPARVRGWRRWSRPLLAIAAAGIVAGLVWLFAGGDSPAAGYVTDPAVRGDLTVVVTATGSVQPTNRVDVSSELSGTVRRVMVDYNSRVKAGEVLAELDTDKLKAQVASSRAKLAAARAKVAQAEATGLEKDQEYKRKRALGDRQVVSTQDIDTAKAALDRAQAELDSARADVGVAEAELSLNETNLAKACICSPIDGVVLERNVDPGQTVASSFQAPVLFSIAEDLKQMEIQVDVDEADVGKVREGQEATFTVDAYPDRKFAATVRQLRFGSEVVQGVVTYKAVLATENPELLLRPGMTATAGIAVEHLKDALLVANAALRFSPLSTAAERKDSGLLSKLLPRMPQFRAPTKHEGGPTRTVWVLRNGQPAAVSVTVGSSNGRHTQILKGEIVPGEPVIVGLTNPNS